MIVSHSRVETFRNCPYRFKLRYRRNLRTLPPDNSDNALLLGTALHTGIESGAEGAIRNYYMSYSVIDDGHITEAMKLEYVIPRARAVLPDGEYEVEIKDKDFIGYIDLLAPALTEQRLGGVYQVIPNMYDIYDFKYSNNVDKYMESPQLHLYKYFFEKSTGKHIRDMYFLFVPKVNIKQKKTEDLYSYRKRIRKELQSMEPRLEKVEYDQNKVIEFLIATKNMIEADDFPQNETWLCNYCEYSTYCKKGEDYMILPSTERRNISGAKKRKIWIYGAAFSGKTTMLDSAPNPLNLNTDGNVQFVTMPYIGIKDEVTVTGRMTSRKFAWEVFKEAIDELEKKQNDFETVIIDLLEDTREMCRIYMYDKLGIQHESDSGFGKGWDIIKTEYLSTMRRFFNMNYENLIVVSHEDISKDITKKNGQNITKITPNIQEAIANKIAGMVDIVARVVVDDDGTRTLNFKQNEVIFGGGRLKGIKETEIPLSWDALVKVYDDVNASNTSVERPKRVEPQPESETNEPEEAPEQESEQEPMSEAEPEKVEEQPRGRRRATEEEEVEEAPKSRVRKRRE